MPTAQGYVPGAAGSAGSQTQEVSAGSAPASSAQSALASVGSQRQRHLLHRQQGRDAEFQPPRQAMMASTRRTVVSARLAPASFRTSRSWPELASSTRA